MADLFKPGAYTKGTIVVDQYGVQWIADVDIKNALAAPRDGAYWTRVEAAPIPLPSVGDFGNNLVSSGAISVSKTEAENSEGIERFINSKPEMFADSVYIPAGDYRFSKMIHLYRKPINLFGDNGSAWANGTRFYFPPNTDGIFIDRAGQSIQETIIERIFLIGGGGDGSNGSGIRTNARVKIRDVTAKKFSRNGFDVWANMEGESNDASGSIFESCHALENLQDGFFAGRTDANAITYIGCDSRDNGRYGFNDDSFLGNNYLSCMAHYNKGGDVFVRDEANTRTVLVGFYSEGGNAGSRLGARSVVIGGTWGTGFWVGNVYYQGSYIKEYNDIFEQIIAIERHLGRVDGDINNFKIKLGLQ